MVIKSIPIGISSCLVGEKVRWNGGHKQDRYITDTLGNFFDWVPVCPEVEVGMGIPRETVSLYGAPENPRMRGKTSQTDWTDKMQRYSKARVRELEENNLCGFIFKSKSPSCGINRIPVYAAPGSSTVKRSSGLFAKAFALKNPLIPIEEEGRLTDLKIRENFIIRVFSFYRLKTVFEGEPNRGDLVQFHTQNKFLLLAHSRKHYGILGKWIGDIKRIPWSRFKTDYSQVFMEALAYQSTPKKNADVLYHLLGFFKKHISPFEKKNLIETIEDFRKGHVPLIVPVTLIRHFVKKLRVEYLESQIYLNPHPKELMLRNHV